jgi:regulatory protein
MSIHSEDFQYVLSRAYFYLRFRHRTKKEMTDYLLKKTLPTHISSDVVYEVIAYLEEQNFINDAEFIRLFVDQRNRSKPKSTYVLTQELAKLGVSKDLINIYFSEQPLNESAQAREALSRKWSQYSHLDKRKRFEKAVSFLGRRGFSFDIIKKTIAEMDKEE